MGFRFVSVSSEVNPLVKVYPRASTTTLDAYLNKYSKILSFCAYLIHFFSHQKLKRLLMQIERLFRAHFLEAKDIFYVK